MGIKGLSRDQVEALVCEATLKVVQHAYRHVPFYRKRYDEQGIRPEDIKGLDDFSKLPVVTRQEVIDNWREMIDERQSLDSLTKYGSGGSTGAPVTTYHSSEEAYKSWALEMVSFSVQGIPYGTRMVRLWGAPQDVAKFRGFRGTIRASLQNDYMLNAFVMDAPLMGEYVKRINRLKPYAILAYPEAADLLARYILENELSIHSPRAIVTSAGVLLPTYRENITTAFGCPVLDRYGCREAGVVSYQCPQQQGLHIFPIGAHVEVVRDGDPVPTGVDGHVLLTPLRRRAMPLIRYDIGDVGRLLEQGCSCSLSWPTMEVSVGRTSDILVTSGGGLVAGSGLTTYMANVEGLRSYQIEQAEDHSVTVKIVTDERFTAGAEETIHQKLAGVLGQDIPLTFVHADSIPPTRSGKVRPIVSRAQVRLTGRSEIRKIPEENGTG